MGYSEVREGREGEEESRGREGEEESRGREGEEESRGREGECCHILLMHCGFVVDFSTGNLP